MKQKIHLFILFLFFSLAAQAQGFLKADGQKITNEKGEEVILRGIGLGGWMLQEGYMLGTSGPQHELEARFKLLVGEEKMKIFYDKWLENHVRKIDIDSMAAWGYNSIRLPMHYKLFTPPIEEEPVPGQITWREKGFQMVDNLLQWVKDNNMYLILDLHAAPGGQGKNADISDYNPSKPSLWESEANKQKMIALWKKLAERYANEPNIGAYDIINEPNWGFENLASDPNGCSESKNTALWALQKQVTEAIREVDQNHMIIIEGNCWGNNYNGLPTLWDNNLVISYHKYWNANNQASIQNMLNMRSQRNVPIWLGESGENSNSWFTDAISLLESNNIGWSWWPLKKLGYNNPLQVKRNEGYQKILDYWSGKASKPSVDEANNALLQFAEDLKLENNIYHKDVVDAMIRQIHSDEPLPFKENIISSTGTSRIFAVDFDLGRHDVAYHDADYTNTTGNAGGLVWNKGRSYRNDGVDIQECTDSITNGYNVGWTEDGEWLQYSLNVEQDGYYTLNLRTATANNGGKAILSLDEVKAAKTVDIPNTGNTQTWQSTEIKDVHLKSGINRFRIIIEKGGFNINYLEFSKQDGPSSNQPEIIEGKIKNQEKTVDLVFNQELNIIPSEHGFTVSINGESVIINNVNLKENNPRVVQIQLETAAVYGNNISVSYTGTTVTTSGGIALSSFSNYPIQIFSDIPIIHVPGKVEVEDFTSNHGFEFETCSDTGGGKNAGYTDSGDFLDYTILVEETGYYKLSFRVASESASGEVALLLIDNQSTTELERIAFTASGGWQKWKTASADRVYLEKGLRTIRLLAAASLFNINWFDLSDPIPEIITGSINDSKNNAFVVYPNPSTGKFKIQLKNHVDENYLTIHDMQGRIVWNQNVRKKSEVEIEKAFPSGVYILSCKNNQAFYHQKILIQ